MEIALESSIPTYSGGLGVLAGDTIRAAADMKFPMVAVTLLHRKGYFSQTLDSVGTQHEAPTPWPVDEYLNLKEVSARVSVSLDGRTVALRAWQYDVKGATGHWVPVYLLDTGLDVNSEWDRRITDSLYGGDKHYRLCQEVVLGCGGIRLLRSLGYDRLGRFHMNEGHSSLLALELLDEEAGKAGRDCFTHEEVELVRKKCVFTTHTPVAAGHDQFPLDLVKQVTGRSDIFNMKEVFCCEGVLNMTYLALNLSHFVNGVAKKHGEISRLMFAKYPIDAITNGVHAATWVSSHLACLFDEFIAGWREDNFNLRYALKIPKERIEAAHAKAKGQLLEYLRLRGFAGFEEGILTIGFARRATGYKRADLLFQDIERLRKIVKDGGPIQIIFAGKAHPHDLAGKGLIRRIYAAKEELKDGLKVAYLQDYDIDMSRLLVSGVDVWLNTPMPPLEASGTSGMKAAMNGVPSLSVLDGWWIEGCIEGITGWAIGEVDGAPSESERSRRDALSLYDKLEKVVLPRFYCDREAFVDTMKHAIALNGSFFNTQRMLQQYALKAYLL
jgi:starch phosphorylase